MYAQDSFFDLTVMGRVGLVCISLVLSLLFLWITRKAVQGGWPVWARIAGALALFWVFVWVSPQVYFQYYHLLFEDLPVQWVIFPPPSPLEAGEMLTFTGRQNLSAHGQGVLGWMMIAVAVWGRRFG